MGAPLDKQNELDYQAQLDRGFRNLRFSRRLEQEFQRDWVTDGMWQLRAALVLGFSFGLYFLALDYMLGEAGQVDQKILYRSLINQSLILLMFIATFIKAAHRFLQYLGSLVCLSIIGATVFVRNIGVEHDLGSPMIGQLVVTFYAYLFIGLRFWPALGTALGILALTIYGSHSQGLPTAAILYSSMFLVFANLIGSTGLYNIEYHRRKSFLEARQLKKLAGSDPMTGLSNRAIFSSHFERVWGHCRRTGESLTVALVDVDQFKKYNDHYGHQAGDRCLQRIAQLIGKEARRPMDLVARYGGEEFVLLLPNCTLAHARERLQNVRRSVEDLGISHAASKVAPVVTISAGVAQVSPLDTQRSPDGLIQMADEALYSAKQQGRNRVAVTVEDGELETGLFRPEDLAPTS